MARSVAVALLLCASLLGSSFAQLDAGMGMGMGHTKFFKKHHKKPVPVPVPISGAPVSSAPLMAGAAAGAMAGAGAGAMAGTGAMAGAAAGAMAGAGAGAMAVAGALTPQAVPAQCLSVAEVAAQAGTFNTLLAAAQAAGLAGALSDRSLQATVFVPTDEAFALALAELGLTAELLLAQPDLLAQILKYHVVPGAALTASQLRDSQELSTLLAADLEAEAEETAASAARFSLFKKGAAAAEEEEESRELTLDVLKVYGLKSGASRRVVVVGSGSSAEVVVPDVNAGCPAIVHVIDNVLLPTLPEPEAEVEAVAVAQAGAQTLRMPLRV